MGLSVLTSQTSCTAAAPEVDASTRYTRGSLEIFAGWLSRAGAEGFVGEFK